MDFGETPLRFRKSVHKLSELDLDKGNVEFEMNLGWGDGECAAGIVERVLHGSRVLVLFAFKKPNATKTGEDLRIRGAVFV